MQYNQLRPFRLIAAAALLAAVAGRVMAADGLLQPFAVRNLNPFIGVYATPLMRSPSVVEEGHASVDVVLDVASNFTDASNASESIDIDGETYRLALRYARGLARQWEAGVEVPLVTHSGGFMDGFINKWHQTFGLPSLGRNKVPDDRLRLRYVQGDRELASLEADSSGLGDILLFTGKTVTQTASSAITLRGQLKLPTGDPDRLLGSGGMDLSASASFSRRWGGRWLGSAQLGLSYLGDGDVLPGLQRNWVGSGSVFLGWRALRWLGLKVQFDAQTPIYQESELDQLTDPAAQLTIGGSVRLGASAYFDFAVTEDEINPDVSPDVSFEARLRFTR